MSERLTGKNDTKCSMSPWDWCGMDSNCKRDCFNPEPCKLPDKLRRLAEYEDALFDADGNEVIGLARLRELAEAEKEGRVAVMPCKVGDIVFALAHCGDVRYFCDNDYETGTGATTCPFEKQCGIEECDNDDLHAFAVEVAGLYFDEKSQLDGAVIVNELDIDLSLSDFGKRVFVIEAEAARALSEKGEDDGK